MSIPRIVAEMALAVSAATYGAEPQVFFGLMHGHTSFSDGSRNPDEAFETAREAGLDFMAITEHIDDYDQDFAQPVENTLTLIVLKSDFSKFGGLNGLRDLQLRLVNKAVRIRGAISLYRNERVQLRLTDPSQILAVTESVPVPDDDEALRRSINHGLSLRRRVWKSMVWLS
jgi:hypothetical protein